MHGNPHAPGATAVKIIAVIYAILFVIATVLGIFLFNINQMLLSPTIYKQAFLDLNLYPRAPQLVAGELAYNYVIHQTNSGDSPGVYRNFTQSDWQAILQPVITPDWARSQVESLINQFFQYLNSSQPNLALQISLAQIKNSLSGGQGVNAALQAVQNQPACTQSQLAAIQQTLIQGANAGALPVCNPTAQYLNPYVQLMGNDLSQFASALPTTVAITMNSQGSGTSINTLNGFRKLYQALSFLSRFSLILPAVLLLLLTIFAVRSAHDWMVWWGVPLFIAGLITLILAFAILPASSAAAYNALNSSFPNRITPDLAGAILDVVRDVGRQFATRIGIEAVAIAIIGAIMIAISPLVRSG